MKNNWIGLIVLTLALACVPVRAGAQDKTSKVFTIVTGHVVTIGWTASSTSDVTSYNVYVSSTRGGPYLKIGNTSGTFFGDVDATAGNTYFYVVTAVDAFGESANSTEVSVIIPN